MPEDDRKPRSMPGAEESQDMEDDTGKDQSARSSVDVDNIWKVRQSTIWDMRHDPDGGRMGWDFSNFQDRNKARRKMNEL